MLGKHWRFSASRVGGKSLEEEWGNCGSRNSLEAPSLLNGVQTSCPQPALNFPWGQSKGCEVRDKKWHISGASLLLRDLDTNKFWKFTFSSVYTQKWKHSKYFETDFSVIFMLWKAECVLKIEFLTGNLEGWWNQETFQLTFQGIVSQHRVPFSLG